MCVAHHMASEPVCAVKGTGTAEDIDLGMILSDNHPIGPLMRADLIGAIG